ncbi:MAG: hypothetical protein WD972_02860, partial [Candidatus Andersenbacteria bacterium]
PLGSGKPLFQFVESAGMNDSEVIDGYLNYRKESAPVGKVVFGYGTTELVDYLFNPRPSCPSDSF